MAGMVIIGGGECGVAAALTLREAAYSGSVTLIGDESHLPYERPPLSKSAVCSEREPMPKTIASNDRLSAASVRLPTSNSALGIDRLNKSISLADNRSITYEKLLLATDASSRRLPETPPGVAYLRTHEDALHICRREGYSIIGDADRQASKAVSRDARFARR